MTSFTTKIRKFPSYLILLSVLCLMILLVFFQFKIEIDLLPDKLKEIISLPVFNLSIVFLSLAVGVFSYFNHNKLDFGDGDKVCYFHDFFKFIFIVVSILCFTLGGAAFVLVLVSLSGQANNTGVVANSSSNATTKAGISDLISASGFILAVVSAYYLWALARAEAEAEAEAKKITNEMQSTITRIVKIAELNERRLNNNSNSLSHLYHIGLRANLNIISVLKKKL